MHGDEAVFSINETAVPAKKAQKKQDFRVSRGGLATHLRQPLEEAPKRRDG